MGEWRDYCMYMHERRLENEDAMAKQQQIWEVKSSDGVRRYYHHKVEADFAYKDTVECGFGCSIQAIPVPQTPKDFCAFMERQFEDYRGLMLAARRVAQAS